MFVRIREPNGPKDVILNTDRIIQVIEHIGSVNTKVAVQLKGVKESQVFCMSLDEFAEQLSDHKNYIFFYNGG